jgi:hypothetical protein
MPLHLIKLGVGTSGVDDFERWIKDAKAGRDSMDHITRSFPKRANEILPGGSLYWIVKGVILLRTPIKAFEAVRGGDGIERCRIVFNPEYMIVRPSPRRAFQGWRYFDASDAPPDMPKSAGTGELSSQMRRDLAELGLL